MTALASINALEENSSYLSSQVLLKLREKDIRKTSMVVVLMSVLWAFNPFKCQPHKIVKHTQTIRRLLPTNCWSVFDHL